MPETIEDLISAVARAQVDLDVANHQFNQAMSARDGATKRMHAASEALRERIDAAITEARL